MNSKSSVLEGGVGGRDVVQVVESLTSMQEAPGSIPAPHKTDYKCCITVIPTFERRTRSSRPDWATRDDMSTTKPVRLSSALVKVQAVYANVPR